MPTNSYSARVQELVLSTVWSLWVELGLSGWSRRHSWTAIDLEPLLVSTAYLGRFDARLLQETVGWCVASSGMVSAVRLRNHLKEVSPAVGSAYGGFAATVREHTRVNWPGDGQPIDLPLTHKSSPPDMSRPALMQLRLRAAFGVSARAEILRLLAAEPARSLGIAELAKRSAFGREIVADTLRLLAGSGVLEEAGSRNQRVYRMARPIQFENLFGPFPTEHPDWASRLRVMIAFLDFSRSMPEDPIVRATQTHTMLRSLQPDLTREGIVWPLGLATGEGLNKDFEGWSLQGLSRWAGSEGASTTDAASYTVNRLANKAWVGMIQEPGGAPHSIEMPEWAGLYQEHPRSDSVVSDDSVGAPRLAHAMFQDAFRRIAQDIGPYWSDDSTNQVMSREFAQERLWPMYPGSSATWSDQFMRSWWADRQTRLGERLPMPGPLASDSRG